ncbi:MAG: hypothetical protein HDR02_15110 [Lachnospiraceae bacterium]|nr:hypothetical protein [Lachnospiraceae bacterium]
MRLIDANVENERLLDFITQKDSEIQYALEHKDRTILEETFLNYFNEQKTAYDVDKVVEQLRESKEIYPICGGALHVYAVRIDKAINAVKEGGIK